MADVAAISIIVKIVENNLNSGRTDLVTGSYEDCHSQLCERRTGRSPHSIRSHRYLKEEALEVISRKRTSSDCGDAEELEKLSER